VKRKECQRACYELVMTPFLIPSHRLGGRRYSIQECRHEVEPRVKVEVFIAFIFVSNHSLFLFGNIKLTFTKSCSLCP